jgi:hypothetical protein
MAKLVALEATMRATSCATSIVAASDKAKPKPEMEPERDNPMSKGKSTSTERPWCPSRALFNDPHDSLDDQIKDRPKDPGASNRLKGTMPDRFEGNRAKTEKFLSQFQRYAMLYRDLNVM